MPPKQLKKKYPMAGTHVWGINARLKGKPIATKTKTAWIWTESADMAEALKKTREYIADHWKGDYNILSIGTAGTIDG